MRRTIVVIKTDHDNSDEAARSVMAALKRAGYDVDDYETGSFGLQKLEQGSVRDDRGWYPKFVQASEPDLRSDRGPDRKM